MQQFGWAPIDDSPPVKYAQPTAVARPSGATHTECNYLVMFFVAGIFLLALTDSMK
jgi:hypothetical protein